MTRLATIAIVAAAVVLFLVAVIVLAATLTAGAMAQIGTIEVVDILSARAACPGA
jgi:hypothetical protein